MRYTTAVLCALLVPGAAGAVGSGAGPDGSALAEARAGAWSEAARAVLQQRASITGVVTDAQTRQPLANVSIAVRGTRQMALSDAAGRFIIVGVEPGTHTLVVSRLGYRDATETVTLTGDTSVRVEIGLTPSAVGLDEIVVTATGQQRRVEIGNSVATIQASEIAQTAPVTSINDLLTARAAGVQIIQSTGQSGASSQIRIRGMSSISLSNEPLVIVDGIRYDNTPASGNFTTLPVSRLGSLSPEEIESIDIIRGPSAAALYGTAAANGVLVIRTRRGQPGRARWTGYFESGIVQQPNVGLPNYWSFGRNINQQTGQPTGGPVLCRTFHAAAGLCQVDSLSVYNPWTAPETDPFADQNRYAYGINVAGGSETLRYFLSGERQDETGPYQMPASEIQRLTVERGGRPRGTEINPNQLTSSSVRANFGASLRPNLNVDVSTGYADRKIYSAFEGTFFGGLTFQYLTAPGYRTPTNGTQREFVGDVMGIQQLLHSRRFTGSISSDWQPYEWLTVRGVTGIDQDNSRGHRLQYRGEGTRVGQSWGPTGQEGGKDFDRSQSVRYSADLGATATYNPTDVISTRTSIGLQWFRDGLYQGQGRGYGLPVGASTPNAASRRESWEFTTEQATYGAFLEERLGWRDVLFATLGIRTDQNSAFGRDVGNTIYPRASLSYAISDEDWFPQLEWVNALRLRTSYGKAGVQPGTIAALQFLGAAAYPTGAAADEPGLRLASIGNPNLRPEVTTEIEGGFDLSLLDRRVNLEFTAFRKRSQDALFQQPLPPSYGTAIGSAAASQWANLASVENTGLELSLDATLVRTQAFSWRVNGNGSTLSNKLIDAGDVQLGTAPGARHHVGFPLFGLWDRPIISWDGNRQNLTDADIVVGDTMAYRGSTLPRREAGLGSTLGFMGDALTITGLLDYRGDFYKFWQQEQWRCVSSSNCAAVNDPTSPIEDQVAAIAANSSSKRTNWGYFAPNDYLKFRELSIAYRIPQQFTSRLGASSTTLVLSGRNLGYLWTKYPGLDPESNNAAAALGGGGNSELTAQGPIRYWIARINVAF